MFQELYLSLFLIINVYPQTSYFEKVSKYVEIEKRDIVSIVHFISELNKMKVFDQFDICVASEYFDNSD